MSGKFRFVGLGRVGNDPEITSFDNGGLVASFSIASTERWKDKETGDRKERTEWARIVVRDKGLIENVIEPYVKKGSQVYVEATPETRSYDKDGVKHNITEYVIRPFRGDDVTLADTLPKQDRDARSDGAPRGNAPRTTTGNGYDRSAGPR